MPPKSTRKSAGQGEQINSSRIDKLFSPKNKETLKTRSQKQPVADSHLSSGNSSNMDFSQMEEREEGASGGAIQANPHEKSVLDSILAEIQKCHIKLGDLSGRMDSLASDVTLIRDHINKMRQRVISIEKNLPQIEGNIKEIKSTTETTLAENKSLKNKIIDLEDRSRRANIRIVGMPEGAEEQDIIHFCTNWIAQNFDMNRLSNFFVLERAHRVPARKLPPGSPPRTILIKTLMSKDRDVLLKMAREAPELRFNDARISFYPDFAKETQVKRSNFREIKQRLRRANVGFSLLFPAKLRVIKNDKVYIFHNPQEVGEWMEAQGIE